MSALTLFELKKSFGDKEILKGISVSYEPGLIHGIVGENGSGKTTFFRCLAGLTPYEGRVVFQNLGSVSFLPAELYTYPFITGLEFVKFCLSARNKAFDAGRLAALNDFLQLPLNEYAENYSTGMLKKLYLATILLQDDDIIILDEPFNGLDVSTTIFITEVIKRQARSGKTLFVSSHIMQHLNSFCDSISWLSDGKLQFFENDYGSIIDVMTERAKIGIEGLGFI